MSTNHSIINKAVKYSVPNTSEYPMTIVDGKGSYLKDANGNWYLDFNSNVASCPLGYRHPEIMKVKRQYASLGAHKIAGQDFYTPEAADLAEALVKISPKTCCSKVFLINSGAEAVENAIKFAYRRTGPRYGISFEKGFHGRTLGALTFTHSKIVHKKNYPELQHHVLPFVTEDSDPNINEIDHVLNEEGKPAFVIIEAQQGEGGYRPASTKFVQKLRRVTRRQNIALILDEVQAGMGRTGKWWSFEHYDIQPDIFTAAKALQVGATICADRFCVKESGSVSSTWGGGDRLDLAVGLKTIEVIKRENLLRRARVMGGETRKRLLEFKDKYRSVTDVRGLGFMLAIEINNQKFRNHIVHTAFRKKLSLLGCGDKSIRIVPPLNISEKDLNKGLDILEGCLR